MPSPATLNHILPNLPHLSGTFKTKLFILQLVQSQALIVGPHRISSLIHFKEFLHASQ